MNARFTLSKSPNPFAIFKQFFVVILLLTLNTAQADTHVFKNSVSTNWSDVANWTPAALPDVGDDVEIPTGETLTLDGNYTVNSFKLENAAFVQGTFTLTITNNFNWEGGTIDDCMITVGNTLNMTASNDKSIREATIEVTTAANWSNGNLFLGNNSTLKILSSCTFSISHMTNLQLGQASNAVLDIAGTLNKTETLTTTVNCSINLSGTININGGTIYCAGDGTYTGDVIVASGSFFDLNSGTHNFGVDGSVSGSGGLNISGATTNFNAGSNNTCDVTLTGGGIYDNTGLSIVNVTQSASSTFGGTITTTISGTYNWSRGKIAGSLSISGNIDINGSSTKTLEGAVSLTGTGSSWSNGTVSLSNGATFSVATSGTFEIAHTGNNKRFGSAAGGTFDIQGTVTKTASSLTLIRCAMNVSGSGVLNLNSGTVRLTTGSSGAHSSTLNIASGAVLEVQDGSHNFNTGSTVTGAGVVQMTNQGIAIFNSGSSLNTELEIEGSSSVFTDNVGTNPSKITQSDGLFDGTGSPVCSGALNWSGGTIGGTNKLTINGLSTFSGTTRTLNAKTLETVGNSDWTAGDFVFVSTCTLLINSASVMSVTHSISDQQVTGTGLWYIMGTMQKTVSTNTTNISVDVMNDGRIEGVGTINFSTIDNVDVHAPGENTVDILKVNVFDNSNGSLEIEISGNGGAGTGHDQLQVTGNATLGGSLSVSLLNGFVPNVGDSYTIVTGSTVTGTFSENLPALPSDREWVSSYDANSVTIAVSAVLPVELVRFYGEINDGAVELIWQTLSETNNKGFEIQRSYDGTLWKSVGFKQGGGTTSNPRNYSSKDYPNPGKVYYRLRQLDFDGSFELSKIISLNIGNGEMDQMAKVYPNPIEDNLFYVDFSEGLEVVAFYYISNQNGRIIQRGAFEPSDGPRSNEVKVNGVALQGVYYLTISSGDKQETVKLLFK